MQIQFGTSSKRVNSTFIPAMSRTYNCTLKRPCTIETPVVDISDFNTNYNVAYIPDFHRYYFVTSIVSISNDITRYYLSVDVLATYKSSILDSTVYVRRSQNLGNKYLKDPAACHTCNTPNTFTVSFDIPGMSTDGIYILQTAAPNAGSIAGGNCIYALTQGELSALISEVFDSQSYGQTATDEVKTYFNPFQYITSCRWFPVGDIGVSTQRIKFGWWTAQTTAGIVTQGNASYNATVIMPASIDWSDHDPEYTRFNMYIPGIGDIEIDPAFSGKDINVSIYPDWATGIAIAKLRCDGCDIASASGQWGIDVQLTQFSSDPSNMVSTIMQAMGFGSDSPTHQEANIHDVMNNGGVGSTGGLGTVDVGAAAINATATMLPFIGSSFRAGIQNLLQAQLSMSGANGSRSYLANNQQIKLSRRKYDIYESDINSVYGTPCERNYKLERCTGFTICNNASITIPSATAKEKISVKNYLEGGFWIE